MTVSLDALLLLAKLEYAAGDHSAALSRLNNAGLDKLQEKPLTTRSLKIVAESFAIKGTSYPLIYFCPLFGNGKISLLRNFDFILISSSVSIIYLLSYNANFVCYITVPTAIL